jgi:hypothetical protein
MYATFVRNSGVYIRPRGPLGGLSGVYFPVRAPAPTNSIDTIHTKTQNNTRMHFFIAAKRKQHTRGIGEETRLSTLGDRGVRDQSDAELVAGRLHPVLLRVPVYQAVVHLVGGERDPPLPEALVRVSETFLCEKVWYGSVSLEEVAEQQLALALAVWCGV